MNAVETAKEIRKILKAEFPKVKFSVRSKLYSGGSSVTIGWVDGPTSKKVEAVTLQYQKLDICKYTHEVLSGGNAFIFTDREISPELRAWAEEVYVAFDWATPHPQWRKSEIISSILAEEPEYSSCSVRLPEVTTEEPIEVQEPAEEIAEDLQGLDTVQPITELRPYFVEAQFAHLNKNSHIADYVEECTKGKYDLELAEVKYTLKLNIKQWNCLLDGHLLTDFDWIKGKGGSNSLYNPVAQVNSFYELSDKEQEEWRKSFYHADCILVTCGHQSIVINPEGYSYARYVGLNPAKTQAQQTA